MTPDEYELCSAYLQEHVCHIDPEDIEPNDINLFVSLGILYFDTDHKCYDDTWGICDLKCKKSVKSAAKEFLVPLWGIHKETSVLINYEIFELFKYISTIKNSDYESDKDLKIIILEWILSPYGLSFPENIPHFVKYALCVSSIAAAQCINDLSLGEYYNITDEINILFEFYNTRLIQKYEKTAYEMIKKFRKYNSYQIRALYKEFSCGPALDEIPEWNYYDKIDKLDREIFESKAAAAKLAKDIASVQSELQELGKKEEQLRLLQVERENAEKHIEELVALRAQVAK